MGLIEDAKNAAGRLIDSAKDQKVAHDEKAESDTTADPHVAGARDGDDHSDGEYVGRTNPQFDADAQQTGAEARSEAERAAGESAAD